jgi:hypothetical protein
MALAPEFTALAEEAKAATGNVSRQLVVPQPVTAVREPVEASSSSSSSSSLSLKSANYNRCFQGF